MPLQNKKNIMQDYNLEYRRFTIAKLIVGNAINNNYAHFNRNYNDLLNNIRNKKGLSDACLLLKMVKKELDSHNSKNTAERTRLNNLKYKGVKVYKSILFKKYLNISTFKIDKAIKENIDLEDYEIYRKCFQL